MMFWNTLMGINSFIVLPATLMYSIYAIGREVLYGEWVNMIVAILALLLCLITEVILAIKDDA